MKSELIMLKSLTQANRAYAYLAKQRIRSSVERITLPQGGCGFGIRISDDPSKICGILAEIGIQCIKD